MKSAYCFEHTLIKVTGIIKLVHEIGLACDHQEMLITNQESLELFFLYTFKPMCRTTLETPWSKVQNLLGMKFTTDVTLLFLSTVINICICFFFYVTGADNELNWITEYLLCQWCGCLYNLNECQRNFHGNWQFSQLFLWWMDCSHRIKDLLLDKFSV